ncbi:hypothetical protein [Deinococcus misasensis]|uniref:hypothetical protein n=1 Tax=Deinococcus misasensis TaxID=392413 RepID=UPI00054FB406|nr:hypothetical protein [Deinococcus misasensis]
MLDSNFDEWLAEEEARELRLHAEMTREVQDIAQYTLALAITGVNQGVYDTPEGIYQRTRKLFMNIDVINRSTKNRFTLDVKNSTRYASDVEFGTLGQSAESTLQAEAEALGEQTTTLYKGRTARRWRRPNPAHLRAAVWAGLKMNRVFEGLIQQIWP